MRIRPRTWGSTAAGRLLMTDQVSAAFDHIRRHAIERFGLVAGAVRPSRLLGARAAPRPDARSVLIGRAV